MFLAVYILLFIIYLIFNAALAYGWDNIKMGIDRNVKNQVNVTIIITVRNEEEKILDLLHDLEKQSYPLNKFEVFIFNDHSTDQTAHLIEAYSNQSKLNITLFHLSGNNASPKKQAITQGVNSAKGELIMITDGDCQIQEKWISSFVDKYQNDQKQFIFGPVSFIQEKKFFNKLATVEFASLIGAGAASWYFKKPTMCNAANLAFSKQAFIDVGGYEDNQSIASGDDVFLMNKIFSRNKDAVAFLKHENAIVLTHSECSLKRFFYQRVRWASKWKLTGDFKSMLTPLFVFTFHLATLTILFLAVLEKVNFYLVIGLLAAKILGEWYFIRKVMQFLNQKANVFYYAIASLIYPFYAVIIGLAANFVPYIWKGRKYKD